MLFKKLEVEILRTANEINYLVYYYVVVYVERETVTESVKHRDWTMNRLRVSGSPKDLTIRQLAFRLGRVDFSRTIRFVMHEPKIGLAFRFGRAYDQYSIKYSIWSYIKYRWPWPVPCDCDAIRMCALFNIYGFVVIVRNEKVDEKQHGRISGNSR
jgi:hypothetical protein